MREYQYSEFRAVDRDRSRHNSKRYCAAFLTRDNCVLKGRNQKAERTLRQRYLA
ncbi:MAG: hypothetical protein ACU84H_16820 [Gammaproteobacteria bacterium]